MLQNVNPRSLWKCLSLIFLAKYLRFDLQIIYNQVWKFIASVENLACCFHSFTLKTYDIRDTEFASFLFTRNLTRLLSWPLTKLVSSQCEMRLHNQQSTKIYVSIYYNAGQLTYVLGDSRSRWLTARGTAEYRSPNRSRSSSTPPWDAAVMTPLVWLLTCLTTTRHVCKQTDYNLCQPHLRLRKHTQS